MGNPLQPVAQMPVPASTANTHTDLNGLAALKKDSKSPQAIHAIAQQVDALFARYEGLQPGEKKAAVGRAVPLGYMGRPDQVASAAVFLASDEASYITAQTLNVDGGSVMS